MRAAKALPMPGKVSNSFAEAVLMLTRLGCCCVDEAAGVTAASCCSFACEVLRDRLAQAAIDRNTTDNNNANKSDGILREGKEDFSIRVVSDGSWSKLRRSY